ncbi:MAG: HNH endonuclease [Desulfobacteraceae bacterium]|nr:HNH endonuclease [Desulfobacteraceae bacterium]
MRPIQRGSSPLEADFDDYKDAKPYLISRLGIYCSYCERRIATMLAVEHIQPKALTAYEHLAGRWENFLLGCVNCNSTKGKKNVMLADILLPDRDNTFAAFTYLADGTVKPADSLSESLKTKAQDTLALTGLDKKISTALDENDRQIAIDRLAQRMEVWAVAEDARDDIVANPGNEAVRQGTVRTAAGYGFFSIWMTVFEDDPDMRNRLIDIFSGTRNSGCFVPVTTLPISPAPNPDNLLHGSKI